MYSKYKNTPTYIWLYWWCVVVTLVFLKSWPQPPIHIPTEKYIYYSLLPKMMIHPDDIITRKKMTFFLTSQRVVILLAPKHYVPAVKRSAPVWSVYSGAYLCLWWELAECQCLDVKVLPVNDKTVSWYGVWFVCVCVCLLICVRI